MTKQQIFIVEDDQRLADMLGEYLQRAGFAWLHEADGEVAIDRIVATQPDLVILDVMLPTTDGLDVCRRIRPRYCGPVLMLTARGDDIDQVLGLELGADDYVTKPASLRVILARVKTLLRRGRHPAQPNPSIDGLVVSDTRREVTLNGTLIELTSADFELLKLLYDNAGTPLTRQELMKTLRGIDYDGLDRSIDVRVVKLRQKLGDNPNRPSRIKTVRGVGYMLVAAN